MRCLPLYLGSNQNGYLWTAPGAEARRAKGRGCLRRHGGSSSPRTKQRPCRGSSPCLRCCRLPFYTRRGALLPLHRGRGSLSYATKSPLETLPLQDSLFPSPLGAPFGPSAGILGPALAPDSEPKPFTPRGLHCLRAWNGYFGLPHFSGGRGSIFFSYFLLVIFFPYTRGNFLKNIYNFQCFVIIEVKL